MSLLISDTFTHNCTYGEGGLALSTQLNPKNNEYPGYRAVQVCM